MEQPERERDSDISDQIYIHNNTFLLIYLKQIIDFIIFSQREITYYHHRQKINLN